MLGYDKDYGYADTRLRETLVRTLAGDPYFIYNVSEEGEAHGFYTLTNKEESLPLEELNLTPVVLGGCNQGSKYTFLSRSPLRHYKQGLNNKTIRSSGAFCPSVSSSAVGRTVKGLYPNLNFAGELILNGESKGSFFSRDFGFLPLGKSSLKLMYRTHIVGQATWSPALKGLNLQLGDNFKFLSECLGEQTNA